MKKNLFFTFVVALAVACCAFAADWVQIAEKIYLDASSLTPYNYNLNFDKDEIYSIWSKSLNDSTENWKNLEKFLGKKLWYKKSMLVFNCTKREIALRSIILYDLQDNVVDSYDTNSLDWQSIAPETIGEVEFTNVCRATAPQIKIRSHR